MSLVALGRFVLGEQSLQRVADLSVRSVYGAGGPAVIWWSGVSRRW